VELLRRQAHDAKRGYDAEVVRHGDALKRYAGGWAAGWAAGWRVGGRRGGGVQRMWVGGRRLAGCRCWRSRASVHLRASGSAHAQLAVSCVCAWWASSAAAVPHGPCAPPPPLQPWRRPTPACSSGWQRRCRSWMRRGRRVPRWRRSGTRRAPTCSSRRARRSGGRARWRSSETRCSSSWSRRRPRRRAKVSLAAAAAGMLAAAWSVAPLPQCPAPPCRVPPPPPHAVSPPPSPPHTHTRRRLLCRAAHAASGAGGRRDQPAAG
jgi:hypothetical protein